MTAKPKFIQVGELAKSITENTLLHSGALAGRSMQLNHEDGSISRLAFDTADALSYETAADGMKTFKGTAAYRATTLRKDIYLVDYLQPERREQSVSHVLNLKHRIATTVLGALPSEQETRMDIFSRANRHMELTAVGARFVKATIDNPYSEQPCHHAPTTDMIGKRVMYVYSKTEAYEHIYLNENFYTWQCLAGIEKGLADTDRCHYYKIDEGLYLFVWREKIVPTLGVVMVDFEQMKTTGKLIGYESGDFRKLTNAPLGAYATLLNVTEYPDRLADKK